MTRDDFISFLLAASRRAIRQPGRIGRLVLTQTDGFPNGRLREPEMRHALAQEAEVRDIPYGIEVPTVGAYRFTKEPGTAKMAARHDFVLLERDATANDVLLELKAGQPAVERDDLEELVDCPAISKDLQKLLRERASSGLCMLHVLHATDKGTIPALLQKYGVALRRAVEEAKDDIERAKDEDVIRNRWFVFAILVQHQRNVPENPPGLCCQMINDFLPAVLRGEVCFAERGLFAQPL